MLKPQLNMSYLLAGAEGSVATSLTPRFNPELGILSVWSSTCSSHVWVGFLRVSQFPPTSLKHTCWTSDYIKQP